MSGRWISVFLFILFTAGLASAQDVPPMPTPSDEITVAPINFDQVAADTITQNAIYDWWQLNLQTDDVIVVEMQAFQGLSPLIGILDPSNELVARSDTDRPPEPNGLAAVQYRAEQAGLYTISATREGNASGTTVGVYQLRVSKVNFIPERLNDLAPVEFRCEERLATNVLMLSFQEEVPSTITAASGFREDYRLSIYGQNEFAPLILADADLVDTGRLDCDNDAGAMVGNTYTLPGEQTITLTEAEQSHAAQLSLQNTSLSDEFGEVRFTLGSLNAAAGRYMVILEGLSLQDANDIDTLIVRAGPLAAEMPIMVYVVGENPGRLDLSLQAYAQDFTPLVACDDAGRSDCADVPAFVGAGATFLVGNTPTIIGDRFDAGIRLPVGTTEPMLVEISSGGTGTRGAYTVFIIGELPSHK